MLGCGQLATRPNQAVIARIDRVGSVNSTIRILMVGEELVSLFPPQANAQLRLKLRSLVITLSSPTPQNKISEYEGR